jgi:hypothetical protein
MNIILLKRRTNRYTDRTSKVCKVLTRDFVYYQITDKINNSNIIQVIGNQGTIVMTNMSFFRSILSS